MLALAGCGRSCTAAACSAAATPPRACRPLHTHRRSFRYRPLVVAARLPVSLEGADKTDLPQWLTLLGYTGIHVAKRLNLVSSSFQLTSGMVFTGLTYYSLAWAVLSLVGRDFQFDRIGSAVGPIFLAVQMLGGFGNRISPLESAVALFGYFMADDLPAFPHSRWAWLCTLAAAIYKGMPAQWLVAAFGLGAVWRLVRQLPGGGGLRLHELLFAGLAGWAFYAQIEGPMALLIMAADMAAAAVS